MQYHEVRIVAELRKQGEHERAEEVRLTAMRRTPRRIPEHLVPLAGTPSDSPPLWSPTGTRADAHAGDDDRHGEAASVGGRTRRTSTMTGDPAPSPVRKLRPYSPGSAQVVTPCVPSRRVCWARARPMYFAFCRL
jgi:hypothetical protein